MSFFSKLQNFLRYYHGYCKKKTHTFKADEDAPIVQLEDRTKRAEHDLVDIQALNDRDDSRLRLEVFQERQARRRQVRSRTRWKLQGDIVTKEFFRTVRHPGKTTHISAL